MSFLASGGADREDAVTAREGTTTLGEDAAEEREEVARLRETASIFREEAVRARDEATEARSTLEALMAQLREADEANRLKDEFYATLSHELRTPLHAVLGWARILMSDRLPPDRATHAIEAIERNASALAHLLEDFSDVDGTVELDQQPVDLGEEVPDHLLKSNAVPADEVDGRELWREYKLHFSVRRQRRDGFQRGPRHGDRKIRQYDAGHGRCLPVLALTGYARAEDRARIRAAGFQAHVAKPVEPAALPAVIAASCENTSPNHSR